MCQLPFCFQGMPLMMPAQGLDTLNRRNPRQRLVGIPVFTPYRRQLAVRAPGTVAPAQLAFNAQQAGIDVGVAGISEDNRLSISINSLLSIEPVNIVFHLVYPYRRPPCPVPFSARQACLQLVVLFGLQIRITYPATFHRSEEHTSELQSRPHLVCR